MFSSFILDYVIAVKRRYEIKRLISLKNCNILPILGDYCYIQSSFLFNFLDSLGHCRLEWLVLSVFEVPVSTDSKSASRMVFCFSNSQNIDKMLKNSGLFWKIECNDTKNQFLKKGSAFLQFNSLIFQLNDVQSLERTDGK